MQISYNDIFISHIHMYSYRSCVYRNFFVQRVHTTGVYKLCDFHDISRQGIPGGLVNLSSDIFIISHISMDK